MRKSPDRIRVKVISRRVAGVLHDQWDPIGVSDVPEARGEYAAYVGTIAHLLLSHASTEEIADQLRKIAVVDMGLEDTPSARRHHFDIAGSLVALLESI